MSATPDSIWLAHLAATAAMAGILWAVQLAIYPLFGAVGRAEFPAYHRRYATAITWVVGPLMFVEGATAGWLLVQGQRGPVFLVALALLGVAWLSTFALQVPLHAVLAKGYADAPARRLVLTNWLRTAAWTARALLLLALSR